MIALVCGSRSWWNKTTIWGVLDGLLEDTPKLTLWSGGASGPDTFAIDWAVSRDVPWVQYKPIWNHGKHAGFERNAFMVEKLSKIQDDNQEDVLVIAFWDEQSRGTKHTIDYARRCGVHTEVWT